MYALDIFTAILINNLILKNQIILKFSISTKQKHIFCRHYPFLIKVGRPIHTCFKLRSEIYEINIIINTSPSNKRFTLSISENNVFTSQQLQEKDKTTNFKMNIFFISNLH